MNHASLTAARSSSVIPVTALLATSADIKRDNLEQLVMLFRGGTAALTQAIVAAVRSPQQP